MFICALVVSFAAGMCNKLKTVKLANPKIVSFFLRFVGLLKYRLGLVICILHVDPVFICVLTQFDIRCRRFDSVIIKFVFHARIMYVTSWLQRLENQGLFHRLFFCSPFYAHQIPFSFAFSRASNTPLLHSGRACCHLDFRR